MCYIVAEHSYLWQALRYRPRARFNKGQNEVTIEVHRAVIGQVRSSRSKKDGVFANYAYFSTASVRKIHCSKICGKTTLYRWRRPFRNQSWYQISRISGLQLKWMSPRIIIIRHSINYLHSRKHSSTHTVICHFAAWITRSEIFQSFQSSYIKVKHWLLKFCFILYFVRLCLEKLLTLK